MNEARIVRQIMHRLHKLRLAGEPLFWFKTHGEPSGIPDIIVCYNGQFISFEVKTLLGRLRKDQECLKRRIEGAGGKWYLVRSADEVEQIILSLRDRGDV